MSKQISTTHDRQALGLNLLLIFDAILAEGNVTRAAERLQINQSTVSKGLAQLRKVFDDPLFLRAGRGVVPTHKASELAEDVRQAIAALHKLTEPAEAFEPATAHLHFNIGATDYVAFVMLPALLAALARQAPHVTLAIHDAAGPEEMLLSGKVDLALSTVAAASFPLYRQELFHDRYVCMYRRGHPLLQETGITLEQFFACQHLSMPRQNGARERILQDAIQREGLTREVTVQVPHMLAIAPTLEATDLISTVAGRVARAVSATHAVQAVAHPLELPGFAISQLWHDRTQRSASHEWLRRLIATLSQGLPDPAQQLASEPGQVFTGSDSRTGWSGQEGTGVGI